ncbi:MAG TPA: LAGLIDADG family homing endonuclease [Limnobacter sp.]|nr:LAGLIDADG family homing endonuclease [Limnobacter sp.]
MTVEALFKSKARPRLHACDDHQKLVPRQVKDVVWNGYKPVFRLTTKSGRAIVATGNHPFMTARGWVNLENLSAGELLATARHTRVNAGKSWPAHEVITLAGLLSEGNTCHPSNLFFYNNDLALIDDFSKAAVGFDNTAARVSSYDGKRHEVCLKRAKPLPWNHPDFNQASRSGARLWAESLNLVGVTATFKRMPEEVFELVDANIELLLGRMWSGDGSLSLQHTSVYYATSSLQLAQDVRCLLMRLGICATLHNKSFRYRDQIKAGYTVNLVGHESLCAFVARVLPHVVGRESQAQALRLHVAGQAEMSSKDVVPAILRERLQHLKAQRQFTWQQMEAHTGLCMKEMTGKGSANKRGFRRSTVAKLAHALQDGELLDWSSSDVFWDEIVAIEPAGHADTYDLEIEEHHNFVADGFVVHNSHSAAYALVAYHTAWLKAHYPAEFMAASMSSDMDDTDKVKVFVEDAITMCQVPGKKPGTLLTMLGPDVNASNYRFAAVRQPGELRASAIRYGLGAIKGTGQAACEAIVAERQANGPFVDLYDFVRRVDSKQINRRVMEALIRAGAFDALQPDRAKLLASAGQAMEWAAQQAATASQVSLFGDDLGGNAPPPLVEVPSWSEREKLQHEKSALGYYFSGHLFKADEARVREFVKLKLKDLSPSREPVWMAGVIAGLRTMMTKRGKMAVVLLDDATAQIELSIFNEQFEANRNLLKEDALLVVQGRVSEDSYTGGLRVSVDNLHSLGSARAQFVSRLRLSMNGQSDAQRLKSILEPFRDPEQGCLVEIDYHNGEAACVAQLSPDWKVRAEEDLLIEMQAWLGQGNARWVFG